MSEFHKLPGGVFASPQIVPGTDAERKRAALAEAAKHDEGTQQAENA